MVSHEYFQWKYLNSLQEHRGKKINKRGKKSQEKHGIVVNYFQLLKLN